MTPKDDISLCAKGAQDLIFSQAKEHGLAFKVIAARSRTPESTLRTYAGTKGKMVEMPVGALNRLCGVIPEQLLSLLLPDGWSIVRIADELDHDAAAEAMGKYLAAHRAAIHPDSPAGREISDCEDKELRELFAEVRGVVA